MSWSSIHFYRQDPETIKALCPGFACRSLTPEWVTLADSRLDWGGGHLFAAALSTQVAAPVLSFDVSQGHPRYLFLENGSVSLCILPPHSQKPLLPEPAWLRPQLERLAFSSQKQQALSALLTEGVSHRLAPASLAKLLGLKAASEQLLWQALGAEDEMSTAAILAQALQLPLFVRPGQLTQEKSSDL